MTTKGKTLNVFSEQSLGDVAEFNWKGSGDPNAAAALKEMAEQRDKEQQTAKERISRQMDAHAARVDQEYNAYIQTPEGRAWFARMNARQTYKGHRKQTFAQQVRNQVRK